MAFIKLKVILNNTFFHNTVILKWCLSESRELLQDIQKERLNPQILFYYLDQGML